MVASEKFRRERERIDASLARRSQYTLPVVEKPTAKKTSKRVCVEVQVTRVCLVKILVCIGFCVLDGS